MQAYVNTILNRICSNVIKFSKKTSCLKDEDVEVVKRIKNSFNYIKITTVEESLKDIEYTYKILDIISNYILILSKYVNTILVDEYTVQRIGVRSFDYELETLTKELTKDKTDLPNIEYNIIKNYESNVIKSVVNVVPKYNSLLPCCLYYLCNIKDKDKLNSIKKDLIFNLTYKDYNLERITELKKTLSNYNIIQSMLYIPKIIPYNETSDNIINIYIKNCNYSIVTNMYPLISNQIALKFGKIATNTTGISTQLVKRMNTVKIDNIIENKQEIISEVLTDNIVLSFGSNKLYKTNFKEKQNALFSGNINIPKIDINESTNIAHLNKEFEISKLKSKKIAPNDLIDLILNMFDGFKIDTTLTILEIITPDNINSYLYKAVAKYYSDECILMIHLHNSNIKKVYNELSSIFYNYSIVISKSIYSSIREYVKKNNNDNFKSVLKDALKNYFIEPLEIIPITKVIYMLLKVR